MGPSHVFESLAHGEVAPGATLKRRSAAGEVCGCRDFNPTKATQIAASELRTSSKLNLGADPRGVLRLEQFLTGSFHRQDDNCYQIHDENQTAGRPVKPLLRTL